MTKKTTLLLLLLGFIQLTVSAEVKEFAIDLEDLFDYDNVVNDTKKVEFKDSLDGKTLVKTLGFGWNLGNTLDAHNSSQNQGLESETYWGNPETTEEMIDALVAKGFKAIRIPVTWHNHLIDEKYTICPDWMSRVKKIVDWCIDRNMYVILNTHHDNANYVKNNSISYGKGYYPLKKDMEESERFLYNIWRQIATTFNRGYDHHLIFEGMNEPRMVSLPNEWWYLPGDDLCEESVQVINQYNKLIVRAIRSTGGNNRKRFIMVTGHAASYDYSVNSRFAIPDDPDNQNIKRLLVSVHMYAPYQFVMEPNMTNNKFTPAYRNELYQNFKRLNQRFVQKGYYVVIGEMGIVNKNNTQERIAWGQYYLESCRNFQLSAFLWDNGIWDNSQRCDDTWAFFRRAQLTWENGNFIDAVLQAASKEFKDSYEVFAYEPIATFNKEDAVRDYSSKKFDVLKSSKDIVNEIGFGWNLGNTFDATCGTEQNQGLTTETCWGNPKTTIAMLTTLIENGIKAIRIPISWHNHLIDDKYTIDPEWMYRVKTVVDWATDKGLYVIINTHHDQAGKTEGSIKYGSGYYPLWKDAEESEKYLYNVWKQITLAFNNGYDHHLIFEGLNEPRIAGLPNEWWYEPNDPNCKEAAKVLNEYNRLILKAIRDSKGNNNVRFVMTTALAASYSSTTSDDFIIPEDHVDKSALPTNHADTKRIIVSVHMYTPYNLVMNPDMNIATFTGDHAEELYVDFKTLYQKYVLKGYHVIIGEMGIVNKSNLAQRIKWAKYYIELCRQFQFAAIIWDNGNWDNSKSAEETYGFFDRRNLKWVEPTLMKAFIDTALIPFPDSVDLFEHALLETYDKSEMVIDKGQEEFNLISSKTLIDKMAIGWNLGNTFDAHNSSQNQGLESETYWGNPETTEEMIEEIADKGFKAIRIPVTWHNHLIDEKYTICPDWMSRVKKVVDWSIKHGLYVILNTHHDNADYTEAKSIKYGKGYYPLKKDMFESEKFLYNVWKQIATAFNNGYGNKLIFEGMNEPRMRGMSYEWSFNISDPTCREAAEVLNEYNKVCVKAIRETGGNNEHRFILVTGLSAGYDATMNSGLVFPDDKKYNSDNRLLLSVHMYMPYEFAMKPDMEISTFTEEMKKSMFNSFKNLYFKYIQQGIHIVVGEMGTVNKNNTADRVSWAMYYLTSARRFQFTPFIWDNGVYDNSKTCQEIFGQFIRKDLSWVNDELIDRYISASKQPLENNADVYRIDLVETFEPLGMDIDYGQVEWDEDVTAEDIVEEMGLGWNLGNSLDAFNNTQNQGLSSETVWGNPITTEEMIDEIVDKGFRAVRIPVTWHNHLIDRNYTIDPLWMARVKTVVDWCINKGLYVILNTHHDNSNYRAFGTSYGVGYFPSLKDMPESEKFLYNVWKQIAYAFNDGYDHHLIFEALNEPRLKGLNNEWWYLKGDSACKEAEIALNEYNQLIVKAIRETSGNNALRFIMVSPLAAGLDFAINSHFVIPNDSKYSKENKLIISIHLYSPYDFAMNPDMKYKKYTEEYEEEIDKQFKILYQLFVKKGYNVVIGEFGSINKNNTQDRLAWGIHYVETARKYHMTPFLWDNGVWNNSKTCDNTFGLLDRKHLSWVNEKLVDELIFEGDTVFHKIKDDDEQY